MTVIAFLTFLPSFLFFVCSFPSPSISLLCYLDSFHIIFPSFYQHQFRTLFSLAPLAEYTNNKNHLKTANPKPKPPVVFMDMLESRFMSSRTDNPFFYKHYIDNIFLVWASTEATLLKYISEFINFNLFGSFSSSFYFLDITIEIVNNKLMIKLYRKPTGGQQYLHFTSNHPHHCKTTIPYSQAQHFKRECAT